MAIYIRFECTRRGVNNEPGKDEGPTIGPFDPDDRFVQVTYETLRSPEGEIIAVLTPGGDWEIVEPWTGAGETYSDIVIYQGEF